MSLYSGAGISKDIQEVVRECPTCMKFSKAQQKEPLMLHPSPQYPWQKAGADLFQVKGKDYLVVADYFSLYPEVVSLSRVTSLAVQNALKPLFARHG